MDFNSLRVFVTVAEVLNMREASERLGVAQPAVSQHIKLLESRLQVQLFDRSARRLRLTQLGHALLPEARAAVELADYALDLGEKAGRGAVGTVNLAFVDSAVFGALFRRLLATFRSLYPAVKLILNPSTVVRQIALVADGTVDFAFVRGPLPPLSGTTESRLFDLDPLGVAVPISHELAGKQAATLQDIAEENLILSNDPDGVGLSGHVCRALREIGATPRIVHRTHETASMSALVAAGVGVAILPGTMAAIRLPGVVYLPLRGIAHSELILVHRSSEQRAPALAFLRCYQSLVS